MTTTVTPPATPGGHAPARAEHDPPRAGSARHRATTRTRELTHLLARRPDLAGAHPPADTVAATVTWSV